MNLYFIINKENKLLIIFSTNEVAGNPKVTRASTKIPKSHSTFN